MWFRVKRVQVSTTIDFLKSENVGHLVTDKESGFGVLTVGTLMKGHTGSA